MRTRAAIDQRIAELVGAHRPELHQLVRQRLDAELEAIVVEELARAANGNGAHRGEHANAPPANAARTCNRCGEERPVSAFGKGRGTCRRCRDRQQAERVLRRAQAAAAAEQEPPRADGEAPNAQPG